MSMTTSEQHSLLPKLLESPHISANGWSTGAHRLAVDEAVRPGGGASDFNVEALKGAVFGIKQGVQRDEADARLDQAAVTFCNARAMT